MKAITRSRYGSPDVLSLQDVDDPIVGADDIPVVVRAASVNPAGVVEAVGRNVTQRRVGDQVFGCIADDWAHDKQKDSQTLSPCSPASR